MILFKLVQPPFFKHLHQQCNVGLLDYSSVTGFVGLLDYSTATDFVDLLDYSSITVFVSLQLLILLVYTIIPQ